MFPDDCGLSRYGHYKINIKQITRPCFPVERSDLETAISKAGFQLLEIPKEALFLAGKVYLKYKRRKGVEKTPLPDFFIGAQAAVLNLDLLTRDVSRYQSYFPTVKLIARAS